MSMLAEPRRKQKWSVDPRNSAWSKDDSKFGQKMLERMGWSKGKGLGRTEQGSTDHIKVKVKNDNYGLGTNPSHEDNWIAHQDDFNELLAELNNHHGQNNNKNTETPPEEKKGFSLEEKSKGSRKRVHYMKFTKGKDLSSRTETDLNCIFGKRAKSAKEQEQESNSGDSQGETVETSATTKLDTESIAHTVTSTLSMQEYFAQRMAQIKKARGEAQSASPSVRAEADETAGPSEEPSPIHTSTEDSEEPKKKKKKKKKKSKESTDELEVVEENSTAPIVIENDEDQQQGPPEEKKKKKKKKSKESAEVLAVTEENSNAPVIKEDDEDQQQECREKKKKRKMDENETATNETCSSSSEELPPSKRKKKHKKHNKETEPLNGHEPTEDQTVEAEVVQEKKKNHKEEGDDVVKEEEEVVVEKKSKKDKKKKRKHQE
ncbi:PIN2/TERF1-interacting telomerase inhibitor 1 [Acanthopagrus latus]|uniref:PIN2/TERF1-interacting telomerase inhibitor 1 n=1 Tax=Acanthopagrus latus TaxID=8177 RepID=UPI00187BDF81|nr:PIN2/TERF1-interacting telomerase inhibitor 1 [Acanthopagrus latus]